MKFVSMDLKIRRNGMVFQNHFQDTYNEILDRTMIYKGNTYRLQKAVQRVKKGNEKVSFLFLGGSITRAMYMEEGYVEILNHKLQARYGQKITCINCGIAGTSSVLGLLRVEQDVILHSPDVVFLEFAVNDAKDSFHREMFESLIHRIWHSKTKPAIVLLLMATEQGYSCQGHMQAIGEHYQLPIISIYEGIYPEISANRMKWSMYADDNIHPNRDGSFYIADAIENLLNHMEAPLKIEVMEENLGTPFSSNRYMNMRMLDSRNLVPRSYGGFIPATKTYDFAKGWMHTIDSNNKPFQLNLRCKSLIICYTENNHKDYGDAQVFIDGQYKGRLPSFRIFGWDNLQYHLLLQEEEARDHCIEVSMASENENKFFMIIAFGYCE